AALQGRDVLLSGGGAGEPPLRLDLIALDAAFDARAGALEVSRAQFIGPTAKAALSGVVRFGAATPSIRLGLVADPMPVSAAKKLWPFLVAPQARAWVLENVADGSIDSLTLSLDVPAGALADGAPLPDGSMALTVVFTKGRLRPRPGLPWVEQARGRIEAVAGRVDVLVDQGQIPGANGVLALSNLRFEVTDTAARYPKATARFNVDGALDPVLALLGSGALGPSPLPARLDPARTSGRLSADVTARFELGHPDGEGPQTRVDLTASIADASIADVAGGRGFEKGAFTIRLRDGRTDISGSGSLAGAPVSVSVTEAQPAPDAPRARRLTATLKADGQTLERFGLHTFGRLRGTAPLEASLSLDEPGSPITVSADLKALAIDGVVPGFRKAAGDPGRLSLTIAPDGERTAIRNFVLESGERRVHGALTIGPKGELVSASFPIYRPSPGDDARIDVDKSRVGAMKVSVQGSALDLRPLVDLLRGKSAEARGGAANAKSGADLVRSLDVQAKLGTGVGFGGEAMAGIDATLVMRDGKVTDADGSARIGAGPIRLATAEDGRFRLTGEDAGALFRFADLYGRIEGGRYDLSASLVGGPGLLRVRDFAVRNEVALARVQQTAAAARGPTAGATRFDRLRIVFVEGDGRIDVREAALAGPQYGATLEGQVDYAGDRVALVGTFVPAYALNNFFARLPLIGGLLGGGRDGGLVGVTFQVTGKTGAPTITVNPVSAVAPGALRKMFEFRRQDASAAEPAPAPAQPAGRR
ncbi:preprotein translocase subunit TatC, partial [Methylopila musalis]